MKKNYIFFILFCLSTLLTNAQVKTPQASPVCTISQAVGTSDISITYSRPGAKNRVIFGNIVPYDKMWRTGANKATKISFSEEVTFAGQKLPAGEYSLFTIPSTNEWEVILNNELNLWGTGEYNEADDVLRVKIPSSSNENHVESLTIDLNTFSSSGADLVISWEKTKVIIPINTNAIEKIQKEYTTLLEEGPSANTYYKGARFFLENNLDLELSLKWINSAIEKRPEAFWMSYQKARILVLMDKNKEAIKVAKEVITMAEAAEDSYGYDKKANDLIKEIK
jgi:hypothetical protein